MLKSKKLFLIISIIFFISHFLNSQQVITNANDLYTDGFGSQFQEIISTVIYAELNNKKFVYTPFKKMEHNYNNDPDFLKKKESLINFIGNFEINENNTATKLNNICRSFCDSNIEKCANSHSLKKIRKLFKTNKNITNHFNNKNLNIVIHLRKPNQGDSYTFGINYLESISPSLYLNIIKKLRNIYASKNPIFHLYSQGKKENFNLFFAKDIILHLDESIEDTFTSMVLADILVTGYSSLSYSAALLSENLVYYLPFRHKPLPHWISTDILLGNVQKLKYNLVDGLNDYVFITPFTEKIGHTWTNGYVWDKPLIKKFYSLLKSHKDFFVAFDIGAQTGSFSLLAKYFPNSKWYAFEPIQEAASILKENLILNNINNVLVYQAAVSNVSGITTIKLPSLNNWGLSTIGENPNFTTAIERKIECLDLDGFVVNQNIKKVHFMKLDTEGSELFILQGAKKMIMKDRPVILMEYNERNMKQCNVLKTDIHKLLAEMKYQWKSISNDDILCMPM